MSFRLRKKAYLALFLGPQWQIRGTSQLLKTDYIQGERN